MKHNPELLPVNAYRNVARGAGAGGEGGKEHQTSDDVSFWLWTLVDSTSQQRTVGGVWGVW